MNKTKQLCNSLLLSLLGKEHLVESWWTSPNKAFSNRTPNEQWTLAPEEVYEYLMHHSYVGGGS
jgi:hypothetical protein